MDSGYGLLCDAIAMDLSTIIHCICPGGIKETSGSHSYCQKAGGSVALNCKTAFFSCVSFCCFELVSEVQGNLPEMYHVLHTYVSLCLLGLP